MAITLPSGFSEQIVIDSGLHNPVGMAFLPDGRLLVIQQGNNTNENADDDAMVKLWANATLSTLLTMPEVNTGGERGLLGVAVHPAFSASNPYIYLFYTNDSPQRIHIARYTVTEDLNDPSSTNLNIDSDSKVILINDIPDDASNHNGGTLRFGPDGKLYISLGDDADKCNAQDLTLLKGKILRIDVDGVNGSFVENDKASLDPGDNPFSGDANLNKRLILAYGLRNPFRFSIDPVTGRVYVGDVGAGTKEEASEGSPPAAAGGYVSADNFAWPYFEGTHVSNDPNCGITPPSNHPPIFEYDHGGQGALSVMGGPVYRGNPYPNNIPGDVSFPLSYDGVYFASEYYVGFLRARRWNPATSTWIQITGGVAADDFATGLAGGGSDWTVGPDGALYYVSQWTDSVRKIAYTAADFDRDGVLDLADDDDDNDGLSDEFENANGLFSMDTDSDDDGIMDGLDPVPGTPNNACTGDNAVYGTTVDSMDIVCAAPQSITIQSAVEVHGGFFLWLISPHVILPSGFTVHSTARFSILNVDPTVVGP